VGDSGRKSLEILGLATGHCFTLNDYSGTQHSAPGHTSERDSKRRIRAVGSRHSAFLAAPCLLPATTDGSAPALPRRYYHRNSCICAMARNQKDYTIVPRLIRWPGRRVSDTNGNVIAGPKCYKH